MKKSTIWTVMAASLLTMGAHQASAACSNSTLNGKYVGHIQWPLSEEFWGGETALLAQFDGRGKIKVPKIVEVGNKYRGVGSASGTYKLQPNCYGTGSVTLRANGVVVGRTQLDFFIGGTKSRPEVVATVFNKTNQVGGRMVLIKSEH